MKRFKVRIRNSKECRTELSFPDLSVKFNNGYASPLKVAEGEEIPFDLLDPEDVNKSFRAGSLKGYMANDWLIEITSEPTPQPEASLSLSHFITEQMILSPGMIAPLKKLEPVEPAIEVTPATPILPEVKAAETIQVSAPKIEPITDLALVKTFEDFERLSQFLKLRFIKDSDNFELLTDILGKTSSVQLKNNITLRLTQVKNT
jgi:hypothetical protein